MEGNEGEILHEIRTLVAEAVARFAVAGDVEVDATSVRLLGGGTAVSTELGLLATQWDTLPHDVRVRRATDIARRLVTQRRGGSLAPPPSARPFELPAWLTPLGIVVLGAAALFGVWRWLGPRQAAVPPPAVSAVVGAGYEEERAARAARVCEATRSRVMLGATVGPTDVEGWVVEILLWRPGPGTDLTFDPGLAAFVERGPGRPSGRFTWNGARDIAALEGIDTSVTISDASLPDLVHPRWRGVKLTFGGRYVMPYFREDQRIQFVRTGAALAERLGAATGAIVARCAHARGYQLGSWFVGESPGAAAATLMLVMGVYAETPHVRGSMLSVEAGAVDHAFAFDQLRGAAEGLDRARVATSIGKHGGMIAGKPEGATTITFPFRDGNRAGRASRDLALELGIGVEH